MDKVEKFEYLGSILQIDSGFEKDMRHKIKCGYKKCRGTSQVICVTKDPNN